MTGIGDTIATLRKEANMTQAELGTEVCVSAQAVSKWERGQAEPDIDTLIRLSKLFHVSMDELLQGEHDSESLGENDAPVSPQELQASHDSGMTPITTREEKEEPLGYCTCCGKILYRTDVGETDPVLVCLTCLRRRHEKEDAERHLAVEKKKRRSAAIASDLRKERKHGFVWGALAGLLTLIIGLVVTIPDKSAGEIVGAVLFGYGIFATVALCIWGTYILDVLSWFVGCTIHFPGVIFSFDLDGLMFLIAVKLLFAVIGFFFGLFMAILGICVSAVLAAVSFPFCLVAKNREIRAA